MNRLATVFGIGFGLLCCTFSVADNTDDQTREIPLDTVWAHSMPGTRDVRELDAEKKPGEPTKHPIVQPILNSLRRPPRETREPSPAFVVLGAGKQALESAKSVLVSEVEPRSVFPLDTELTLVFFSYIAGRYVRLDSVEQNGTSFVVKYVLVSHPTQEMTTHFALIPLGRLTEGEFNVKMQQLPPVDIRGKSVEPVPDWRHIVCGDVSFRVEKE